MKNVTQFIQSPWVLWLFKVIRDSFVSYMGATAFAPTKAWAIGAGIAVVSGVLHAGEAYLTSQSQGTPTSSVPPAAKTSLIVLGLLFLSVGTANAQEKTGFGINPNFVGPAQYVDTKSNGWVLLGNAGLAVSAGWMDVTTTNGVQSLNRGIGLVFEENIGQTTSNQTVNNGILGFNFDYKGINAVLGVQVQGTSLGGPGSNGLIVGASYDVAPLIGNFVFF